MKNCMVMGLVLVGFTASLGIAAKDAKTELEGTWKLVYFERDGKQAEPKGEITAVITGNQFAIKANGKVIVAGTARFDSGKKPKTVDTTYTEGPDKGKTIKGIYMLDGHMLKFCRAGSPDHERPREFKTKGNRAVVSVYKRVKR